MSSESEEYLAVLKASYDYQPQSEDEIAIKENQILFLKERVDEDWWKVKIKGDSQEEDSPVGLVPAAYVEPADHTSVVKAMYDYEANAPGELSVKEDEILLVFDTEEDWLLVQSRKEGGKAGFVPGNYVEATSEEEVKPSPTPQIVIPSSPPPPASTYVDPEDRVAAVKVKADDIKTWPVSEVDKKGKKKKGTLGVGNGAMFFASESDKTPVQKWKTIDIENINIEKSKHVHIDVGGSAPINLHFNAGSKDNADAIVAKLESSKELSAKPSSPTKQDDSATPQRRVPPMLDMPHKEGKKAFVHFSPSSPVIIPPREPSDDGEDAEQPSINGNATNGHDNGEGDTATALYDFVADGDDELSVVEGERLVVLEMDGDEWWKCRNAKGAEGVVPASYVEILSTGSNVALPLKVPEHEEEVDVTAAQEAEERAAAELRERELERERAEKERIKLEAQQRSKAAVAEAERKKRRDAAAAEARVQSPEAPAGHKVPTSSDVKAVAENKQSSSSGRMTTDNSRPPSERTRVWHDRSGQFRVEAAFLGFNNGKLRLHKVNGVIVEVPSEKMSLEDMHYVEKLTSKRSRSSAPRNVSDDDMPLGLQSGSSRRSGPQPKKVQNFDWFSFFLSAGCDVDDCTRYASSFEKDKIDESILPDITDSTMRSLGLREGDIIRVTKAIEKRKPQDQRNGSNSQEQLRRDEELAIQLQAEEIGGSSRGPPNLFAGPGGALKSNPTKRRGRPEPSRSLPPATVDLKAIGTVSDHIQRTTSPQLLSSNNTRPSSTPMQPPRRSSSALAASSGFEDDAWTNRPSSTKPLAPTPPAAPSSTVTAPQPTPTTTAPSAQPSSTNLSKATEADIFDQLSRLSELRKNPATSPPPSISTPSSIVSAPVSYQGGLGVGSSPSPISHHLQNQQIGFPPQPQPYNGPRGPFAPVAANQPLLQPLIPTQTGFNSFIPTRTGVTTSTLQSQLPPPSFLASQPTGYLGSQPLMSQPTGVPFGGFNQSNSLQNHGFGPMQSNPTGFNPGFGQSPFNNDISSLPPVPSLPPSVSNHTSPANVFARMKSGTFASENDNTEPQSSDKYDALRPNPLPSQATGWGGYQGGYSGYHH